MKYEEITISTKYIYKSRVLNLKEDQVILHNKKETTRVLIEHNGGAVGLAITKDRKILFVKQFRKPFENELIELPAGKIDAGETADVTIKREFQEEVGVITNNIEKIGVIYPTPGYSGEVIHMYLALDFERKANHLDEDEFLDVIEIDVNEAYKMIEDGIIVDAKTIVLLLRVKDRLLEY